MSPLKEARALGRLGSVISFVIVIVGFLVLMWSAIAEPIR